MQSRRRRRAHLAGRAGPRQRRVRAAAAVLRPRRRRRVRDLPPARGPRGRPGGPRASTAGTTRPGRAPWSRLYGPAGAAERLAQIAGAGPGDGRQRPARRAARVQGRPVAVGPMLLEPVARQAPGRGVRDPGHGPGRGRSGAAGDARVHGRHRCLSGLDALATGADLLLSEAGFLEGRDDGVREVHLTGRRAGQAAAAGHARRLVLTHLPSWNDPAVTLGEAREVYAGPIELARPGAVYRLCSATGRLPLRLVPWPLLPRLVADQTVAVPTSCVPSRSPAAGSSAGEGNVLVEFGATRCLCVASFITGVPRWKKGSGRGWVTAEYAMLPRATTTRSDRESVKGRVGGRTHEISRLVGRSLRAVVDVGRARGEHPRARLRRAPGRRRHPHRRDHEARGSRSPTRSPGVSGTARSRAPSRSCSTRSRP